jgi:hypothetical protein
MLATPYYMVVDFALDAPASAAMLAGVAGVLATAAMLWR